MIKITFLRRMFNNIMMKLGRIPIFSGVLLFAVFIFSSGFTEVDTKNSLEELNSNNNCENPLSDALGYNAFVRYETHLGGGDTEGPIAIGGNLTMDGIITVAAQTAGSNYFNGDDQASSLIVNGKIIYDSGQGIHLNQGYVKVGDLYGSSVFDRDFNNAVSNTRVTADGYDAIPRIQVQRKQSSNSVGHGNLIDFETIFTAFESKALELSVQEATISIDQYNKISLVENEINVLNISGNELLALPYLTFENAPNTTTPLVINVDAAGDFDWNVFNINAIGDQHGSYILWNFYNASTITLKGGGTLIGTLFAPKANVTKDSSGNINGQVIAANYYHNGGELHQHVFESCIETSASCELTVDAGDDVLTCEVGEHTLSATVSGESECTDCLGYSVLNTKLCNKNDNYVMWLSDGKNQRLFSNVDLEWIAFDDGTATLKGTIYDYTVTMTTYEVDATFTGKTSITPADSPKEHRCNDENSDDWVYYTEFIGTVTRTDGSWSFDISRRGPAFQLGNGANQTEEEKGKFGGSGWFDTTDNKFYKGDFNFNIGDCINTEVNSNVEYLWSTGETTPTITVTDAGTYTVSVKDCENCEATDSVEVIIKDAPTVDAGEDQTICAGDEAILTASVVSTSDCPDCSVKEVTNTTRCDGVQNYVFWLYDGKKPRWFSNVDLKWEELADGTATLTGTIFDDTETKTTYEVNARFSGRTTITPDTSPKAHRCNQENSDGWVYYTGLTGIVSRTDGTWSFDIFRRGEAFQLGNGANQTEKEEGKLGGSGWFSTSDNAYSQGDFNFNIGDCVNTVPNSNVEYLWSTGETTPTITVTDGGTYTVSVKDCENCEATDSVEVIIKDAPTVDAGEDQTICAGDEAILTASVISTSDCPDCSVKEVTNTTRCDGVQNYVLWLYDGKKPRWFSNVDLKWEELADGTATLTGTIFDDSTTQTTYEVDARFSGRATSAPDGSPKTHRCNEENTNDWVYYTELAGTVKSIDGSSSFDISRRGPAFQLGNGANDTEKEEGKFGGSGWFSTSDNAYSQGDFNFNIGDCFEVDERKINYLWSTGETTPSITVTEGGTYTVTVKDCENCESSDEVVVTVNEVIADAGEDVTIALGESVTLNATGGDEYLWSNGATTASIEVSPEETTIYNVTVSKGECTDIDDVTVTVVNDCTVVASITGDEEVCTGIGLPTPIAVLTASGGDTYLWNTGETTATIEVPVRRTSTFRVTVSKGGCSDTAIMTVFAISCPGGGDGGNKRISAKVYPVPQSSGSDLSIAINSAVTQEITVKLHSISGKGMISPRTIQVTKGENDLKLDVSFIEGIPTGIYMMEITDEAGAATINRIIIK